MVLTSWFGCIQSCNIAAGCCVHDPLAAAGRLVWLEPPSRLLAEQTLPAAAAPLSPSSGPP